MRGTTQWEAHANLLRHCRVDSSSLRWHLKPWCYPAESDSKATGTMLLVPMWGRSHNKYTIVVGTRHLWKDCVEEGAIDQ